MIMKKKTANLLITFTAVVLLGIFLLYMFLPVLIVFAANSLYAILLLAIVALFTYGIYRLVSFFNK